MFDRALQESYVEKVFDHAGGVTERQVTLEDRLVEGMLRGTIDGRELSLLLQYWAGRPAQQVKHTGTLKLEQLIAGKLPGAVDDAIEADE